MMNTSTGIVCTDNTPRLLRHSKHQDIQEKNKERKKLEKAQGFGNIY
jgi:hypothetical protein